MTATNLPRKGRIIARWNRPTIVSLMARCTDRRDFRQTFPTAYGYAAKKGWLAGLYAETRLPHHPDTAFALLKG